MTEKTVSVAILSTFTDFLSALINLNKPNSFIYR